MLLEQRLQNFNSGAVDNPYFETFLREECQRRHPCTILSEICQKLKLSEPAYTFK